MGVGTQLRARPRVLAQTLARVTALRGGAKSAAPGFTSNDVYSIAATASNDKHLALMEDSVFLRGFLALTKTEEATKPALTPFQTNLITSVAKKAEALDQSAASSTGGGGGDLATSSPPGDELGSHTAQELLRVFRAAHDEFLASERAHYSPRPVTAAIDNILLDPAVLKEFDVRQLIQLLNYITTIHVKDYNLAVRLARRASDLAKSMDVHQACVAFSRLNGMGVADSFTAILKRVEDDHAAGSKLTVADCWNLIRGFEQSPAINSNAAALVSVVLHHLQEHLEQLQLWQVATSLEVCAKYDQKHAATTVSLLRRAADAAGELDERLLLSVLGSGKTLRLLGIDEGVACRKLMNRAVALSATLDMRHIEPLIQVACVAPINTAELMERMLNRLAVDANALPTPHLAAVIDLVASYPGVQDSPAPVALGTAAAMRSESFDRDGLTTVILGLAEMGFFGDDLTLLCERLSVDKNGFKDPSQLLEFLELMTVEAVATKRAKDSIASLIHHLLPSMTAKDSDSLREALSRLQLDERSIMSQTKARAETVRRGLEEVGRARREADERALSALGYKSDGTRGFPGGGSRGGRGGGAPGRNDSRNSGRGGRGGKSSQQAFNFKKAMWDLD